MKNSLRDECVTNFAIKLHPFAKVITLFCFFGEGRK